MTTESASAAHHNLDLADLQVGQQARLTDATGAYWAIRRDNRFDPGVEMVSGFSIQSNDPTWVQKMGGSFCEVNDIERYVDEYRAYRINNHVVDFHLMIVEIHSVHRRDT